LSPPTSSLFKTSSPRTATTPRPRPRHLPRPSNKSSSATIVQVKHDIDRLNQLRNDLAEQIDIALLELSPANPAAPLHSESPGLIIDRLSILALKIFHTEEQLHRSTPDHQHRNQSRLAVLNEQRTDLAACLDILWSDVLAGRRRFKLYRQLKMYNDPTLNPVLYNRSPLDDPA
jgi:Protein of unknown function (DUF4254)